MSDKSDQQSSSEMDLNKLSRQIQSTSSSVAKLVETTEENIHISFVDIADDVEIIKKHTQNLCDRLSSRRRWPDHETQPRKMPSTGRFLYNNDPTRGLLHEDDKDVFETCQRRYRDPRSCRDPWLGGIDPYANESMWTECWWSPRRTPNAGPTRGITVQNHPTDQSDWDIFLNKPIRPYWILQPLGVVNVYFATQYLDHPDEPICNWLFHKLGTLTHAALSARTFKGAFFPMTYAHWQTRRMLNLSWGNITENVDDRGLPHSVRKIVFQADLFKVHCLQFKAAALSEGEVRTSPTRFGLESDTSTTDTKCLMGISPPCNGSFHLKQTEMIWRDQERTSARFSLTRIVNDPRSQMVHWAWNYQLG